jgi:sugar (pentulose or hexulose) kinase
LTAASSAMVRIRDRYDPDPANRPAYEDAYNRYVELFDALRPLFSRTEPPS